VRVITGISNSNTSEEISAYANAGVDEFFIGYVPKEWSDEYGWELSCNRRETANYQYRSKEELANVVDLIHKHDRKVFLTLNAHEYNEKQIQLLIRILNGIRSITFDGFIVSNIAIILELQKAGFNEEINISIGGGSNNIETIKFFRESFKNIGRIILPRKLTMNEIEIIATYALENQVRLEAFGMSESCLFNDEFCFTWHGAAHRSFCRSPMFEFRKTRPLLFSENWKDDIKAGGADKYYRRMVETEAWIAKERENFTRNNQTSPMGQHELSILPILANIHKCGLCAFKKFNDWGIEAVKLPLRGHGLKANLEVVRLARQVIDNSNATPEFCKKLLNSPNFCSGSNCYYDFPYTK
jgi:collagenase-like PrtC family protease